MIHILQTPSIILPSGCQSSQSLKRKMVLVQFRDEELNFAKFAHIVLGEFPKALRKAFVSKWDKTYGNLPGYQVWDDSLAVRNLFLGTEKGKTKVPTHLSYNEWDCSAFFQATIYARSFALNRTSRHYKTLSDLYVTPCNLSTGCFYRSLKSPTGNSDETFALAIDQLRLLRNKLCHSSSSELDKRTFDLYLKLAKDAFDALGVSTDGIDVISRRHDVYLPFFFLTASAHVVLQLNRI